MSKIRGNSLILARLTMPLKGNICIQRGAFFVKTLFFAQKHSTLMYWQVFITCLITSSLIVECNCWLCCLLLSCFDVHVGSTIVYFQCIILADLVCSSWAVHHDRGGFIDCDCLAHMYVADPLCIAIFIVLVVHKCKVLELVCWWICNAICVCGEALSLLLVGNVNACNSYLHVCNVCVHVCNIGVHVCNIGVSVCDTWLYSLWCEWARRCICVDWVGVQCDCLHALQMCMHVCWCVLICLCTHVHVYGMSGCVCLCGQVCSHHCWHWYCLGFHWILFVFSMGSMDS